MEIFNGIPSSPYFIFIKGIADQSDSEILSLLNLGRGKKVNHNEIITDENCIYISRDKEWIHLMDNWFYTHYFSEELKAKIESLGKELEIFTCSVGDSDMSFDLRYFKDGKKVREYIVKSPNYNNEVLFLDYGKPMVGEEFAMKENDPLDRVIHLSKRLGIVLPSMSHQIICYSLEK